MYGKTAKEKNRFQKQCFGFGKFARDFDDSVSNLAGIYKKAATTAKQYNPHT